MILENQFVQSQVKFINSQSIVISLYCANQ